jgi:hypothetical protein
VKKILFLLFMLIGSAYAQTEDPKTYHSIPDDGHVIIPIPFGFPYYGRVFTHSIMFDNGVVSFYDPLTESARLGGTQYNAVSLNNNIGSNFHYSIMPFWTDLVGNADSKFYTQTDSSTYLKYSWEDVQQWGYPDRLNSFSLQIKPTGFFGVNYDKVDITGYPVTIGHIGDASVGEWSQIYHQPSGGLTTLTSIQGWSVGSTGAVLDCSNPLNSPSCPGYAEAYHDQQCSINSLYATTCPGYQQSYYNQQCSINPLYDSGCSGYQQAYFDQQCSINPLYDSGCSGYQQAYFDQQCSIDPLYDSQCAGYQQAYFDQQCSINPLYNNSCPGYEAAYFNQQCELNSLYNESCAGYQAAYYSLQCSLNSLYDSGCPGYAQAYFDQQCSLNGLYDRACPNYAQVYATQQLLNQQSSTTTVATTEPVVEIGNDGKVSTDVPLVSDPVVNQVLTKKPETKKEEEKKDVAVAEKPKAKSTRQAAPAKVDPATQTQSEKDFEQTVAAQAAAVNAISFVPGFSAYQNAIIPDTNALTMQRQYNKPTVDNARAMRQLNGASDRLHQQMIDEQYR